VGIVERVDLVEQQVAIRFDDRVVKYDFGELDDVSLAYAVTIHKSQGSEFRGSGDPDCHAALHAPATQPDLYGDHAGEEAGRAGRAEEGACYCCSE
jgi:hypothetical protein